MRVRARLTVRSSQAVWPAYTQVSWSGRNIKREVSADHWQDYGQIEWLVTSQRIVGRLPTSSEMYSIWWSGLAGVDIDIEGDHIVLNGMNAWTGMLTGPTLAPIAVAAVAMCHGLEALLTHPSLEEFRQAGLLRPPLVHEPDAVHSGGTVVRLPTRRPTA
jgi:hypothetical protein